MRFAQPTTKRRQGQLGETENLAADWVDVYVKEGGPGRQAWDRHHAANLREGLGHSCSTSES